MASRAAYFGKIATKRGEARVSGMRIRARLDPPSAAKGSFPYPHRSCAEWSDYEQTDEERSADAKDGSVKLRDAIIKAAGR